MSECDCPECRACECPQCRTRRAGYSDDPEINAAVRELVSRFERDPWSNPEHCNHTILGVKAVIAVGWSKRAAEGVRITVH
jgi:hypothetical protein